MFRVVDRRIEHTGDEKSVKIEDFVSIPGAVQALGLVVLPYAEPVMRITVASNNSLSVCFLASSNGFEAELRKPQDFLSDHIVEDHMVFPLDFEVFNAVQEAVGELGIPTLGEIDLHGFRRVIRLKSLTGIEVELDEAVEEEIRLQLQASQQKNSLATPLWGYQEAGFRWMVNLWELGLGGILADEMGVGKTMQLLALISHVDENKTTPNPVMVILPNNLLLTWAREISRHGPKLSAKTHLHVGADRSRDFRFLEKQAVIFTTYSMVSQDLDFLSLIEWELLICDEAHWAKDPTSLRTRSIKSLRSRTHFLATGTPVQNHLLDLWSLVDIVDRGLLGSFEEFQLRCTNSPSEAKALGRMVEHRLLRRTQEDVGLEVPESVETVVPLALTAEERATYQEIQEGKHPSYFGKRGRGLTWPKRQFAAHPGSLEEPYRAEAGQKASYLLDEFSKISEAGEKAIAFVADCNVARNLYAQLIQFQFPSSFCEVIDGQTPQELRFGVLERFRGFESSAILFLNPVVSGEGETIVEANHVFHMNPGWNPAKLDQSSFRVKRPGQVRTVYIHRLFLVDTIEEALVDLIQSKREISEAALEAAEQRVRTEGISKQLGFGGSGD